MKKLILLFVIISGYTGYAQSGKNSVTILTEEGDPKCPPGLCPSVSFYLDVFNLHKPRTGCSSGFGLCIRFDVSVTCHPCVQKPAYESGKVLALIQFVNGSAILRLPASIMLEREFKPDDFSVFEVDDDSLVLHSESGQSFPVRGGFYPVEYTGDEFVVKLNMN